jgi:uncharacterized protein (TIGR00255 family)
MTGFGRATKKTARGQYVAEIRSLNNRFLDINLRLPGGMAAFDLPLRELVRATVSRGKVDCTVRWEPAEEVVPAPRIVESVLERLIYQTKDVRRRHPSLAPVAIQDFLRIPGVVQEPSQEDIHPQTFKAIGSDIESVVSKALQALQASRKKEGGALVDTLRAQHATIVEALAVVDKVKDAVVERYRERLTQRATELLRGSDTPIDTGRLEFEISLFADKADLKEEIDRLGAHLATFQQTLAKESQSVGRSLDFLVQEMLREVNTIGSKCRDLDVAAQVLSMKSAVETIREQVQNIE